MLVVAYCIKYGAVLSSPSRFGLGSACSVSRSRERGRPFYWLCDSHALQSDSKPDDVLKDVLEICNIDFTMEPENLHQSCCVVTLVEASFAMTRSLVCFCWAVLHKFFFFPELCVTVVGVDDNFM